MNRSFFVAAATTAALIFLAGTPAAAQSQAGLDHSQAQVSRAAPGLPLAAASRAAPETTVSGYLASRGRSAEQLASLRVAGTDVSARGVTHLKMSQEVGGYEVYGAYVKASFNAAGELVSVIDKLAPVTAVEASRIDAGQAAAAALAQLYPGLNANLRAVTAQGNAVTYAGGPFFATDIAVTAVALSLDNGSLAQGWLVETWADATNALHYTIVDGDGRVLEIETRTNTDSYNIFPEDPGKNAQQVVAGPGSGNAESPIGWLDASGQTTINISGNNANAYLDTDANDRPDAGGSPVTTGNFLAAADLAAQPSTATNQAVAVQNLFYLNNRVHDILYRKGFDEAAGNFQADNFGLGGSGGDPVKAEAQDGSGLDNANFATPRDGRSPRMQMYLWSPPGAEGEILVGTSTYAAYPAAFGPALTSSGVTQPLAVVSVNGVTDACTSLPRNSLSGTIAIVDRGNCTFVDKVLNLQTAGASAVVIANNLPGAGAFGPGGDSRRVKIPSAMVSYEDGLALKALAPQNGTLRLNPNAAPKLDGDLDSDIVYHEYGHGLSWRMIGGMSGPLAGAIGEGASDVVSFLINGGDVVGEYSTASPGGIRRDPYSSYPRTYSDVDGGEVHDDGEIYAAAMYAVLQNYLTAGLTADDVLGDFVDGMNFTPSTPAFEDMRDGMLASINASTIVDKATRVCAVWQGFAAFGIGDGAAGTVSRQGVVTITESFAVPNGVCAP